MKKKLFVNILLAVLTALFFTGCGMDKQNDKAVKKLNKVYNEDFTLIHSRAYGGGVFGGDSNTEIILESKNYPNKVYTCYSDKGLFGGPQLLVSNYNCVRYKKKIFEKISSVADNTYSDHKIYIYDRRALDEVKDMSFDEYISSKNYLDVDIIVPPSELSGEKECLKKADKICADLSNEGVYIKYFNVVYYKEQDKYDALNDIELNDMDFNDASTIFQNGARAKAVYKMDDSKQSLVLEKWYDSY